MLVEHILTFSSVLNNLDRRTTARGPRRSARRSESASPGERQHPLLTPGDDGLAQKDFDSRRANRRALDRVPHVILGRWVPSQTASWFKLRDRLVAAADAVVDVTAVDRACPTRQMRPDRARNPVFDL